LDTARLGQMSPAARDAQLDFVRLAAEEPSSLYVEQFLRDGFAAWPARYRRRFAGLRIWNGVAGLKKSVRNLAGAANDCTVLLASRSLSLVKFAASCLFRTCRRVLTTDLSWPTYQHVLNQRAARAGKAVSTIALRDRIFNDGWSAQAVAEALASAFAREECDGLFLPAVDHLGIRVPVREIVDRIGREREIRFCVVDAAQAFCHVPIDDCLDCADFVVAGSHKWMRAYLPTGIGFVGRNRFRDMIRRRLSRLLMARRLDDPLLQFTEQLETGLLDGHSETANLAPLFACAGAAADKIAAGVSPAPLTGPEIDAIIRTSLHNWEPLLPREAMRSRIVLYESQDAGVRRLTPDNLRRLWLDAGYVVSAYRGGRVRISVTADQIAEVASPHCRSVCIPTHTSAKAITSRQ
jgi:hypothetical protein